MLNKKAERWLKKKKRKAQFWQVKRFLETLRLKYKEDSVGSSYYSINVPLFGLRFRFNGVKEPEDHGWKVFFIDIKKMETTPEYFREEVMWYLTERGYFAYIRESELGNNEMIFKNMIINSGWGMKIIRKRIELCGKDQENAFMRTRMEAFLEVPLPKIISYYPGFFDYLL
jgi:hypothetical protein